jgi:hypothetical protein
MAAKNLSEIKFVVCVAHSEPDLQPKKLYQVLPERENERNFLRVIDDSGEDYLYPKAYFIPVKIVKNADRALVLSS